MRDREKQDLFDDGRSERIIGEYIERQREGRSRRRRILRIFCLLFGLLLFLGVLLACGIIFFKVETVRVTGSTVYPDEWIVESSGIEVGSNIFLVSNEDVAKRLGADLPFIYSVRVDKHLPGDVELVVFEETPYFYFRFEEEYVVVSKEMKVLDITEDPEYLQTTYSDVREVKMPKILYAVTGAYLRFEDEANTDALKTILSALDDAPLGEKVRTVDFSNRFDVKLSYNEGQFTVLLGNVGSADLKLSFADEIIHRFAEGTTGTVCVDDIRSGYAVVDDPRNLLS